MGRSSPFRFSHLLIWAVQSGLGGARIFGIWSNSPLFTSVVRENEENAEDGEKNGWDENPKIGNSQIFLGRFTLGVGESAYLGL